MRTYKNIITGATVTVASVVNSPDWEEVKATEVVTKADAPKPDEKPKRARRGK